MKPYEFENIKPIKYTKMPFLKEIKDGKPVFTLKTIQTIDTNNPRKD